MGTEYYEVAKPVTELDVAGGPHFYFVEFRIGAASSGSLTIHSEYIAEFILLFRGAEAGKVTKIKTGRIFIPREEFRPVFGTQLISERGEVVYHNALVNSLNN